MLQGAIRFGIAIPGIPGTLASVLQELRGAGRDIAGMSNCIKLLPRRTQPVNHNTTAPPDLANSSLFTQFMQAPQLLAAILSELHTSRQHIAQMHARLRWVPTRGRQPETPTLQVSPTICAIPQNLANIVTELQAMRVDLAGMHSRLQILPGARKEKITNRSRSEPGDFSAEPRTSRLFSKKMRAPSESSLSEPLVRPVASSDSRPPRPLGLLPRSQSCSEESGSSGSPWNLRFLRRAQSSADVSRITDSPSSSGKESGPSPFTNGWLGCMRRNSPGDACTSPTPSSQSDSSECGDSSGGSSVDGSLWRTDASHVPSPTPSTPECAPLQERNACVMSATHAATASELAAPGQAAPSLDSTPASKSHRRGAGMVFPCASRRGCPEEPTENGLSDGCLAQQGKPLKRAPQPGSRFVIWWGKITRKQAFRGA
jgi:hypothetical protein